ncbi:MAG: sugar ABC transporter substrate-binding protein [Leucobacter sp.]
MRRSSITKLLLPLAVIAGLGLAGCSGASGGSGGEADADAPLAGKTIGVAVSGTQNYWDREAFEGAIAEVEALGGTVVQTDGGQDTNVHAENHEIFLSQQVDAVITILGDDAVEPKLKALGEAGIPVFGVDHASDNVVNNVQSDSKAAGSEVAKILGEHLGGKGKVAVFNAFSERFPFCGERYNSWKDTITSEYPDIELLEPELAEDFGNPVEDARQQTLTLLEKYPEGELDSIHVACWDQPALGIVQAIEESGRDDVTVTAIDGIPEILEIMQEPNSPHIGDVAQQPRKIGTLSADNVAKYLTDGEIEEVTLVDVIPVDGADGAKAASEQLAAEAAK